jgi:hypothetical protein
MPATVLAPVVLNETDMDDFKRNPQQFIEQTAELG